MAHINFISDLHEVITQKLSRLGHPPAPEEDIDKLLIRSLNLARRVPPIIEWTVMQSNELTRKSLMPEIRLGLEQFIQKAESGQNLKPHLSKKSDDPDYKDLMFSDWEIFHFHLGTNSNPNHVERTGDLLFAIADSNTARMYLIDIHPHRGGFTDQNLLKIVQDNWAEILAPHTLNCVTEIDSNYSDNDIDIFRKAGIIPILQIPDGSVLGPRGQGIATDGTSILNEKYADSIKTDVCQLQESFTQPNYGVATHFKSRYGENWEELTFKVISFETRREIMEIKEMTTGEVVQFPEFSIPLAKLLTKLEELRQEEDS
ncbi:MULTISPECIES: hypothetical protein [unclassified Microcoleus]|uniref:hypothetical protein n=1 Tax=unclassified Microcoleus TaxID=2642155 RepID=UPI0025E3FC54|nr:MULTISPECIES: hypothetical protein [unclassified Microcoleus]